MTTLPMSDPEAAVAELQRTANAPGHVGIMSYGRSGDRSLDDPVYDDLLATAASLGRPVFIHPQIPPNAVREASYGGFDQITGLALATFGWGWHIEAGLAALRLIVRGTFDRHPDLQIVLGHWGEMLLFALDRIDGLSNVATQLERRVADYFTTNVHVATSGMLTPRAPPRAGLHERRPDPASWDYPFHRLDAEQVEGFLAELPDRGEPPQGRERQRRKRSTASAVRRRGGRRLPSRALRRAASRTRSTATPSSGSTGSGAPAVRASRRSS